MGTGWDMGLLLTIVAVVLIVLGLVWILNGALIAGLLAIIVGAIIGGGGGVTHYRRY